MRRCSWLVALLAMAGCYQQPRLCNVLCDNASGCPDHFTCSAGGFCMDDTGQCMSTPDDGNGGDGSDAAPPVCGMSTPGSFGVGARHACRLDGSGDVFCWGDNAEGQIGAGSDAIASHQTRVGDCWEALAVGAEHSCAIDGAGAVWCWGSNSDGQVDGNDTAGHAPGFAAPTQVAFPAAPPRMIAVAAGGAHSCAIDADHALWCWGDPAAIGGFASAAARKVSGPSWSSVSLGDDHVCGITDSGVQCFGANASGQVIQNGQVAVTAPLVLVMPGGLDAIAITAGDHATCAVLAASATATQGQLFCWGAASALTPGATGIIAPTQVGSDDTWTTARIGHALSCGLDGGQLTCWGSVAHGGFADGLWAPRTATAAGPVVIAGVASAAQVDVAIGAPHGSTNNSEHACVAGAGGADLACWGQNSTGELGLGAPSHARSPIPITELGKTWTSVTAGRHHVCAVANDQSMACWGQDDQGQVSATDTGFGVTVACTQAQCDMPSPVTPPVGVDATIDQVVAGDEFTCTLSLATHAVHCWGRASDDALGTTDAATTGSHAVTSVIALAGGTWQSITGGDLAVCGQATGNAAPQCWGTLPPVTIGSTTPALRQTPAALNGDVTNPSLAGLSFGDNFGCGFTSGSASVPNNRVCWGLDNSGQMNGLGQFNSPTHNFDTREGEVADNTVVVAAVAQHACKLQTDGHVACWGSNAVSESGKTASGSPVKKPNVIVDATATPLAGCTATAVAVDHGCAVCGGAVSCWGANGADQLGRGTALGGGNVAIKIDSAPGVTFTSLALTSAGGCALDTGGKIWCWGAGDRGELGNGGHDANVVTPIEP